MLNKNSLSNKRIKKAALAFMFAVMFTTLSCGKRKPPLPPIENVRQRAEITATQRGTNITVSWQLPAKNASDKSVLNLNRVDIYRLAEPLTAPLALSEEEFSSRSVLISTIVLKDADFARRQTSYTDVLDLAGQPARLRYAVRFVNSAGQKAAFSNFLLIEPTSKVSVNPSLLAGKVSEKSIGLIWQSPVENVDGSTPPNIFGYNVYRSDDVGSDFKLLNGTPLKSTAFNDETFEFGRNYRYLVRTLSLRADGETTESLDSNTYEIATQDTFAPAPPNSITIAAAPNNLAIFFTANEEKDFAGYKIYRSTDSKLPKSDWTLLNAEILTTNTFQDKTVLPGTTYFYFLIAVDQTGNSSEPSEVVFETAQ